MVRYSIRIGRPMYRLEDDRRAFNRVRTQSRLPIYFWSWRGVVNPAPTPAGARGAKAGVPRAEMRSRRSRDLISPEMGDRGHNRHGPKRGGGVVPLSLGALGTRLIQCGLRGGLLPYQVASSSIQPFGHNSVGWHSLRRNISTNY